jgi:hypothetical protein
MYRYDRGCKRVVLRLAALEMDDALSPADPWHPWILPSLRALAQRAQQVRAGVPCRIAQLPPPPRSPRHPSHIALAGFGLPLHNLASAFAGLVYLSLSFTPLEYNRPIPHNMQHHGSSSNPPRACLGVLCSLVWAGSSWSLRVSAQCSASWPDGSTRSGLEPTVTYCN